jgi:hypothetical protein
MSAPAGGGDDKKPNPWALKFGAGPAAALGGDKMKFLAEALARAANEKKVAASDPQLEVIKPNAPPAAAAAAALDVRKILEAKLAPAAALAAAGGGGGAALPAKVRRVPAGGGGNAAKPGGANAMDPFDQFEQHNQALNPDDEEENPEGNEDGDEGGDEKKNFAQEAVPRVDPSLSLQFDFREGKIPEGVEVKGEKGAVLEVQADGSTFLRMNAASFLQCKRNCSS